MIDLVPGLSRTVLETQTGKRTFLDNNINLGEAPKRQPVFALFSKSVTKRIRQDIFFGRECSRMFELSRCFVFIVALVFVYGFI